MNHSYQYFSPETDPLVFVCPATGKPATEEYLEFLHDVDELRHICGFAFRATSGYRHPDNPTEAEKDQPGEHTRGAIDIEVMNGAQRYILKYWAYKKGFTGIGNGDTFIHLDKRLSTPVEWNY